eukprot:RCo002416
MMSKALTPQWSSTPQSFSAAHSLMVAGPSELVVEGLSLGAGQPLLGRHSTDKHLGWDDAVGLHAGQGLLDSFATLAKSTIGSGILGLPFVLSRCGMVPFLGSIVVFAALNSYTIMLLVWSFEAVRLGYPGFHVLEFDYPELGQCAYGVAGKWAVLIINGIDLWGTLVAYFVVIADVVCPVMRFELDQAIQSHSCGTLSDGRWWCSPVSLLARREVVIVLSMLAVWPVCSQRHIRSVALSSHLGLLTMLTFVLFVGLRCFETNFFAHLEIAPLWPADFSEVIISLPVMAFAFSAQFNTFVIYAALKQRTPKRMKLVAHGSMNFAGAVYAILAVLAVVLFAGQVIEPNIISNFALRDFGFDVVRSLFGISIALTIPTACFEVVELCVRVFLPEGARPNFVQRVVLAAGILGSAAVVALVMPSLTAVLGLVGATATTTMSFVFPPAFYLKVHGVTMSIANVGPDQSYPSRHAAWVMLAVGAVCVPLFTFFTAFY